MPSIRSIIIVAALALAAGPATFAVADETRVYDVRELLVDLPDVEAGAALPPPVASPEERAAVVIAAVRGAMPKASAATAEAKIADGQLSLTAGDTGHAAAAKVIGHARDVRSRQAIVTLRALRVTDAELSRLDDDLRARIFAATIDPARSPVELTPAEVKMITLAGAVQVVGPRMVLFSGQRATMEGVFSGSGGAFSVDVRAVPAVNDAGMSVSFKFQQGSLADAARTLGGDYTGAAGKTFLFAQPGDDKTAEGGRRLIVCLTADRPPAPPPAATMPIKE